VKVPESRVIHVEVLGQRYPIRSSLDPRYVQELAAYVDQKMRAATEAAPSSDMLGLAVLSALNIADELFRCRDDDRSSRGALEERTLELERIVDAALNQAVR
jgi:cell division protein ZapA